MGSKHFSKSWSSLPSVPVFFYGLVVVPAGQSQLAQPRCSLQSEALSLVDPSHSCRLSQSAGEPCLFVLTRRFVLRVLQVEPVIMRNKTTLDVDVLLLFIFTVTILFFCFCFFLLFLQHHHNISCFCLFWLSVFFPLPIHNSGLALRFSDQCALLFFWFLMKWTMQKILVKFFVYHEKNNSRITLHRQNQIEIDQSHLTNVQNNL